MTKNLKQHAPGEALARLLGASIDCSCGRTHVIPTEEAVLGTDVLEETAGLARKLGLGTGAALIADRNTMEAAGRTVAAHLDSSGFRTEVITLTDGPGGKVEADKQTSAAAERQIPPGADFLVAVGSGVINDITKHVAEPVPSARDANPAVSRACSDLIGRLMAKDRADRPQTPAELLAAIDAAVAGKVVLRPGPKATTRPLAARPARRPTPAARPESASTAGDGKTPPLPAVWQSSGLPLTPLRLVTCNRQSAIRDPQSAQFPPHTP